MTQLTIAVPRQLKKRASSMRNATPSGSGRRVRSRKIVGGMLLTVVLLALVQPAEAANRRFLVILANPPKSFPDTGGDPPEGFANPAIVNAQYFDSNPGNTTYSFAEWWEEISYGAVTVNGETVGWINLPWPIYPPSDEQSPANHVNIDFADSYSYGAGEPYSEDPMPLPSECGDGICDGVPTDYNGDGRDGPRLGHPMDAYPPGVPAIPEECLCCDNEDGSCGPVSEQTGTCNTEGEDPQETANIQCAAEECCLSYGCEPLCTRLPCSTKLNPAECVALGGRPIFDDFDECVPQCIACWDYRFPPLDTNGLPVGPGPLGNLARGPNIPSLPLHDGVYTPGERFRDVTGDGRYSALFEPPQESGDEVLCDQDFLDDEFADYMDVDGEGFDLPEPFEDSLVRWRPGSQGRWTFVNEDYIRTNYPLNPEWSFEEEVNALAAQLWPGLPAADCNINNYFLLPASADAAECVYTKQEMYRLRGLGWFGLDGTGTANDPFAVLPDAVAAWTNVDEMVWRTGNGIYDPPERFRDSWAGQTPDANDISPVSTKMQHDPGSEDRWTTETPEPGTYHDEAWYETFWQMRYGTEPPPWANGLGGRNGPRMEAFDPQNPNPSFEGDAYYAAGARRLDANAGRPDQDPSAPEGPFNANVEPDTTVGFYDGCVEHDDLGSSKYHPFGDQRLGEITSPFSSLDDEGHIGGIAGHDQGIHVASAAAGPDGATVAGGPLAGSVHGNFRLDGGNVLLLEYMTWRTGLDAFGAPVEGGASSGDAWDHDGTLVGDQRGTHPYAGSASGMGADGHGMGFRDYNLDGLIDQGEVRPLGSENYVVDSIFATGNNGTTTVYPFNRMRMLEDCIAIIDGSFDFDLWHDVNSPFYGYSQPFPFNAAAGVVSEIVLLPTGAIDAGRHNDTFPFSPSIYPIHTNDRDPNSQAARFSNDGVFDYSLWVADPTVANSFYSSLWFFDLVAGLDRGAVSGPGGGAGGDGGVRYQIRYAAHEYGHSWEGYPDLYDYRRLDAAPAETHPIGFWDVMADGDRISGYPVHPVPDLKWRWSDWIEPVDLTTVLTPGAEQEVTFGESELSNNSTFFTYQNPLRDDPTGVRNERFYFWRAGMPTSQFHFDTFMPGGGLLILHSDWLDNPEALPQQQQLFPYYTWYIVQADGDFNLEAPLGSADSNAGDAGDPWPGSSGSTLWTYGTIPNNRWHGGGFSGMDVVNVVQQPTGTRVTFRWTPTEVPVLLFTDPPATMSGSLARVSFYSYDQHAGTTINVYYDTDDAGYNGTLIATTGKDTSGILEPGSVDWNLSPGGVKLPDGLYYLYARLIPGPGQDGVENAVSSVQASRSNFGNGSVTNVTPNLTTSKLEAWTLTCTNLSGTTWEVVGSLSGKQAANAITGQTYTTAGTEVSFKIVAGTKAFTTGDQFVFVTTGYTDYSRPVNLVDGEVTNLPIARICDTCVAPLSGNPPLTVSFDGRASDPNGARGLLYNWNFGAGEGSASGAQVTHTYERPGTFAVTLTVTDIDDANRFDSSQVEIRVNNGKPNAVIVPVFVTPQSTFPVSVQFFGNQSTDPEDLPLSYLWQFTGPLPAHNKTSDLMDPPVQTYFEDPAHPKQPYTADVVVRLQVTDSAGETDVDEFRFRPGNTDPVARIKILTPTSGGIPFTVEVNASDSSDADTGQTLTYAWNFGDPGTADNTATTATAKHVYKKIGTYTITLTVSDGIKAVSTTIKVVAKDPATISEIPEAFFTANPTSGNMPLTVAFDASGSTDPQDDVLTYSWNFGDGAVGGGKIVTHTYTKAGEFTATLTVFDPEGNSDQTSRKIEVLDPNAAPDNEPPVASFNAVPTSGTVPLTVDFQSTSFDPDGDNLSQFWDFGDAGEGDTDSGPVASYTYRSPGTYTVTLTVVDPDDLTDEATGTIVVTESANEPPTARIATYPALIITPDEVSFDATLSSDDDGDDLSFSWEISSDGTPIAFGSELVGAELLVSFRSTEAECNAVAGPCLTPGSYSMVLTADDGRDGVDESEAASFEVRGGSGAPVVDDGDGGAEPGQEVPLTGSARINQGGLCGIGVLTPMMVLGLAMSVRLVRRRR